MSTKTRKKLVIIGIGMFAVACFAVLVVIPELVRQRYYVCMNPCVNNLRQIDGAKQQWFLENSSRTNDVPTQADLLEYLARATNTPFPKCPAGGSYVIGKEDESPLCTAGRAAWPIGHSLDGTYYSWSDNFTYAYRVLFSLMPEPYTGRQR